METAVRRTALGAPNEAKFGFVQAAALARVVHVAGQVGKNNRTGDMIASTAFGDHVDRAMCNIAEAGRATVDANPSLVAAAAHVPGPLSADRLAVLADALGPDVAVAVIGVAALATPEYLVEISATAHAGEEAAMLVIPHLPRRSGTIGAAAVVSGDLVHVGGHLAWGADGVIEGATDAEQLGLAMMNVAATLSQAGSSMGRLLSTHLYVRRGEVPPDFDAICEANRSAVGIAPPAATLVFVEQLPADARVMVTGVAAAGGLGGKGSAP
jgi:enamine deaminase RidA (YjgF/YER057c/UK114 family)